MVSVKIREYIIKSGLKFGAVAEKAHIKPTTFCSMMRGDRKITAEEYFSICAVLGVPLDTFMSKSEKHFSCHAGGREVAKLKVPANRTTTAHRRSVAFL